jgi:hypothetical protein
VAHLVTSAPRLTSRLASRQLPVTDINRYQAALPAVIE